MVDFCLDPFMAYTCNQIIENEGEKRRKKQYKDCIVRIFSMTVEITVSNTDREGNTVGGRVQRLNPSPDLTTRTHLVCL